MESLRESSSKVWYFTIIVYILYFLQGTLYPSGGGLSMSLILSVILLGLTNCIRSIIFPKRTPFVIFIAVLFFVSLTVAFIKSPAPKFSIVVGDFITSVTQYKDSIVFILSLFTGYQVGLHKKLPLSQVLVFTILLFALTLFNFFKTAATNEELRGVEESTNNAAYGFLFLLPFVAIISQKYKKIAAVLASVCFVLIVSGAKRGALICLGAMMVYLAVWYLKRYRVGLKTIAGAIVVITCASFYLVHAFNSSDYLQKRLDDTMEGNSSGRDNLYDDILSAWDNEIDWEIKLLGSGTAETVPIAGNLAHNDWLELLIDNGLFGALIYFLLFVSMISFVNRNRISATERLACMLWIVLWFVKTLFSMGYVSIMGGLTMLMLGQIIGNTVACRQERKIVKS